MHSYAYSIIALQELNLNYFYPRVYWNCACLSCEAIGLKDNEDNSDKSVSKDYGEIAKAIYKMKQSHIDIYPPDINKSNKDFTPDAENNIILYGLSGIAGINNDISDQIINNRPYASFKDFYYKNAYSESLIKKSKMIQLIKAGCFDCFNKNRVDIMKLFILYSTEKKESLTMANISNIIKLNLPIPKSLLSPYNFINYVCSSNFFYKNHPKFKSKKIYYLNEKALSYFNNYCIDKLEEEKDYFYENDLTLVVDTSLKKMFTSNLNQLKEYISTSDFIQQYNKAVMRQEFQSICPITDENHMAFEACSYYPFGQHELANVNFQKYNLSKFTELPLTPVFIDKRYKNRHWKQYELSTICGVLIDRDDNHSIISILTPENIVVNCKMNNGIFAFYKSQISETKNGKNIILEKPWLKRGTLLILCGYRRGLNDFVCKRYKNSIYQHQIQKIISVNNETGDIQTLSHRYGYDNNDSIETA